MGFIRFFAFLSIGVSLLSAGCGSGGRQDAATDSLRVSGTISYRPRVELPPHAVAYVRLVDASLPENETPPLREVRINSPRHVPIRFEFQVADADLSPTHTYALHARITDGNQQVLWATTEPVTIPLVGHHSPLTVEVTRVQADKAPQAFVFNCDSVQMTVRMEGENAQLLWNDQTIHLKRAEAASGAKYTNDSVMFWNKGESASLVIQDAAYQNCQLMEGPWEEAERRGVAFRAVGQEPGWNLEITDDSLHFLTDYGASVYHFSIQDRENNADAAVSRYHSAQAGHRLEVVLEGLPCQDAMSGEEYNTSVTVRLDEREFKGCGRALL
ncbi:Uncharacterized lipoprotein YbaY [Catalinimonas alkaloidigena]|uniref:Uncharacterized lipoprotein YbaY n=1 Tax=Catalinimonas alkaloidigena TaxID=1075417 RepID=A0A1G9SZ49_9BACT|nr:YbaY family lipoprotein [Catalinimonas alkaloidigena]SDM40708.1 Uncharacterized lipoprotein YbaY [Catalinimonas alkaloidigena]